MRSKKRKYKFEADYLRKAKTKNHFWLKFFLWATAFFVLTAGAFWILVFSPLLKIKNVSVSGCRQLNAAQVNGAISQILQEKLFYKIPVDNFFLLPKREIEKNILESFPEAKEVKIYRDISEKMLAVKIEEREPAAIWCRLLPYVAENSASSTEAFYATSSAPAIFLPEAERCFFIDSDGFVFKPAPIISGGAIATVYAQSAQPLELRQKAVFQKTLDFILEAKKQMKIANLNLGEFVIKSQSLGEIEVLALEGWRIYLDVNHSAGAQVLALKRTLEEEIKEKSGQLEYVDLRIENRVYYKLKQ